MIAVLEARVQELVEAKLDDVLKEFYVTTARFGLQFEIKETIQHQLWTILNANILYLKIMNHSSTTVFVNQRS